MNPTKSPQKTLLETCNALPPFTVFYLARVGKRSQKRPKLRDLAKASGLSFRTFTRIARKMSWDSVRLGQIEAFCKACGVDLLRQHAQKDFLRHSVTYNRPLSHLKRNQLQKFNAMCSEWAELNRALAEPSHQSQNG